MSQSADESPFEDLSSLTDLQHVRARPAMYVGSTNSVGLHRLVWEIVDNSLQEVAAGFATQVEVTILQDGGICIEDDGRGIPVEKDDRSSIATEHDFLSLEGLMTLLHYPSPRRKRYKNDGIVNSVGMAVVNYLTKRCEVQVNSDQYTCGQVYERGIAIGPAKIGEAIGRTGTKTTLWPDEQIFQTVDFDYETISKHLKEQAYLRSGVRVQLNDRRTGRAELFCFENGAADFVRSLKRHADGSYVIPDVLHVCGNSDGIEFEFAMGHINNVLSFANGNRTSEGGSHVSGFHSAYTDALNETGRKLGLLTDLTLTRDDYEADIVAVISVWLSEARFTGSARTRLSNQAVENLLKDRLKSELCNYLEKHPAYIQLAIAAAKLRTRSAGSPP